LDIKLIMHGPIVLRGEELIAVLGQCDKLLFLHPVLGAASAAQLFQWPVFCWF
jgi:hypothetical protein